MGLVALTSMLPAPPFHCPVGTSDMRPPFDPEPLTAFVAYARPRATRIRMSSGEMHYTVLAERNGAGKEGAP